VTDAADPTPFLSPQNDPAHPSRLIDFLLMREEAFCPLPACCHPLLCSKRGWCVLDTRTRE
jgi:hypothetical protein